MSENPKVGVFICHCGSNIAGVVNMPDLVENIKKLSNVYVEDYTYMCSDPGLKLIVDKIKEENLERVVVASCTPKLHEKLFRECLEEAGLNKYLLVIANIREQCSWVHKGDNKRATIQAEDFIKMAIERARLMQPQPKHTVPVEKRVLVIGGGVAGITASLNLADMGYEVYLVEKNPTIGGRMAQLDKVFPYHDCSICILAPLMVEANRHPNIKLITYAEVKNVSGWIGNFKVQIRKKPRYIKEEDCTGCGICADYCPIEVPNEFDCGLGMRKAVYMPFPQATPTVYIIDPDHCAGCRNCEAVCGPEAVDLNQKEEIIENTFGAIIITTGYDPFDPTIKDNYGYGRFDNVITSLELERMFCASGPTLGAVVRPSDGIPPKNVVFVQCVGSRDESVGKPYCSRVCCTYAVKEAKEIKNQIPGSEIFVFYLDIRTFGKGFEEAYQDALSEYRIRFIRGRVSKIIENPKTKNLIVRAEDTLLGKPVEVEADLVVLSVGLSPPKEQEKLQSILEVPLSSDGFILERHPKLRPVETQVPGIYVAGCAQSPKDIQDSVSQAGAAAAKVAGLLSKGEVEIEPYVPVINPEECWKCGVCATACDLGVISLDKEGVGVSAAGCEGCGACAGACPSGALQIPISTDAQIKSQMEATLKEKKEYPLIIAFLCNWCAYEAADTAGIGKIRYPTNVRPIWVMCSSRVNPQFILEAFEKGADGVLVMGCYPQDCHYRTGFIKTQRRVEVLNEMLKSIGINPKRLKLESASASEGKKFARVVKEFTEELRSLPTIGSELLEKTM